MMEVVAKSVFLFVPMIAVNLLETYHIYALQQVTEEGGKTVHADGTLLGQLVILLTTIATLAYQIYARHADWKEKARQREWDLEDRRIAREEQQRRTEAAASSVKRELDQTTRTVVREHKELKAAISENTNITAAAAARAAAADARLRELTSMFENDTHRKINHIEKNTEETVERLREADGDDDGT